MDSQILSLYAKGMTTREIVATFKEMYDADVSPTLISKVTDAVKEQVSEWQNRPLDSLYPIVYLDCILVKVRTAAALSTKRFPRAGYQYRRPERVTGHVAG
jgi:putative transposase